MGKALIAVIAGLALMLSVGALPAYAEPGDNGNRPETPPGQEKKDGAGAPGTDGSGKSSGPAERSPSGNNGTIKVHDGSRTAHNMETQEEERNNEPHVGCVFHLYGFHFDGGQTGTWEIVQWTPTGEKGQTARSGSWTATANGDYQSADLTLTDGHYRLNFYTIAKNDGSFHAKHKMFWVEGCTTGTGTGTASSSSSSTGGTTTGGTTTGGTTGTVAGDTTSSGTTTGGTTGTIEGGTTSGGESGTTGGDTSSGVVAGVQTPPSGTGTNVAGEQGGPQIAMLPSTSTAPSPDATLALVGFLISGAGAAMLRVRKPR